MVPQEGPGHGPDRVRRRVAFVRDPGYFLVWDEIRSSVMRHAEWNQHMANYDGQGRLERLEDGSDPELKRVEEGIRDTFDIILMKLKFGDL